MKNITNVLIGFIAIEHIGFLVLEMFLWSKPIGQKIFNLESGFAAKSAALAANQGLYNGFLAAGLIWALITPSGALSFPLKIFFLSCVLIAGLFGWWTVSNTILIIQAIPAALALALTVYFLAR